MSNALADNSSGAADVPEECVWEYPRPPRLERCQHRIRVVFGGHTIADSRDALWILPFQATVPEGKLFTPEFAAARLLEVLDRLEPVDSGNVIAWDGQQIPA
jgi:hypothetical protein